jgi:hypothetical protein
MKSREGTANDTAAGVNKGGINSNSNIKTRESWNLYH